jgi:hypothetical protein
LIRNFYIQTNLCFTFPCYFPASSLSSIERDALDIGDAGRVVTSQTLHRLAT